MKNQIKEDTKKGSDQTDTETDVSRRDFLATSTGAIAAASVLAAGATLGSSEASAAETSVEPLRGRRSRPT